MDSHVNKSMFSISDCADEWHTMYSQNTDYIDKLNIYGLCNSVMYMLLNPSWILSILKFPKSATHDRHYIVWRWRITCGWMTINSIYVHTKFSSTQTINFLNILKFFFDIYISTFINCIKFLLKINIIILFK